MNSSLFHFRFPVMFSFFYFTMQPYRGCSANFVKRIIGGEDTNIESVSYMLSLMFNGHHLCGAGIISEDWAITAAHCVNFKKQTLEEMSIRSGSSVLDEGGIIHNITDIIIHEHYNYTNNDYDIALIRVSPLFINYNYTKRIKFAKGNPKDVDRKYGILCGWGYYKVINDVIQPIISKHLKCIMIPMMKKKTCIEDYIGRYKLTDRMVCYGMQTGILDSCKGDSGGVIVNKDNIILGITSWGDSCAKAKSPGVYTDTIYLKDWIANKTRMET